MKDHSSGYIRAIGSSQAYLGTPELLAYAASKAAMMSMIRTYSVSLPRFGIRSMCITPGIVDVARMEREVVNRYSNTLPNGKMTTDDDLANFVLNTLASCFNESSWEICFDGNRSLITPLLGTAGT